MSREAFITGSRQYGTPREDSDLDLVVYISQEELDYLRDEWSSSTQAYGDVLVLRFGLLNLICHSNEHNYEAWRKATEVLTAQRPVTREFAVQTIKGLLSQHASEMVEREEATSK